MLDGWSQTFPWSCTTQITKSDSAINESKGLVFHVTWRRIHECVFGVLALESEPIDPRL